MTRLYFLDMICLIPKLSKLFLCKYIHKVEKFMTYGRMSYLNFEIIILQNNASFNKIEWSKLFIKDSNL